MLCKISLVAAAISVVSALKLEVPEGPVTSSGTITIKWINEPNDPPNFTIELINDLLFNNALAIANTVDPSANQITLVLPSVPVANDYVLHAVNVGNINDVYAQSGVFPIGASTASINPTASVSAGVTAVSTRAGVSAISTNIVRPSTTSAVSSASSAAASDDAPAPSGAASGLKSSSVLAAALSFVVGGAALF